MKGVHADNAVRAGPDSRQSRRPEIVEMAVARDGNAAGAPHPRQVFGAEHAAGAPHPPNVSGLSGSGGAPQPGSGSRELLVHSPPAAVRGERAFRRVDQLLSWIDGWLSRWLPAEYNPLAQAGVAANFALVVAVVTGVLMLIWYSPSVQFAYSSLAALTDGTLGGTLGGWVRALHRYSSDLAMLLLVIHAGRVFFAGKFSGARWLPWVSGIAMLGLVWFIGWTGYWLVWDQPAQQVAVSSMRLLDGIPIFGEPLGRLYVSDSTVPSLLFFVVFFLHMLLPLAIAVGLAVHLARVSRAKLLPRRGLWVALLVAMMIASAVVPAPLDAPAEMAVTAERLTVDAWYLSPLALGLRFQHAGLWLTLFGGTLLGAIVPWLLGRRHAPAAFQALVTASRCHACTQCMQDCPFDAIRMVPRADPRHFATEAFVDPARCVGCGVCAGSCDSEGIAMTWFDTRLQEARMEREIANAVTENRTRWVAFVAGEISRNAMPELPGFQVQTVPTASWVRPKFLERLFAAGVEGALVVRDARTEAAARDGGRWVAERLAGERTPVLRAERAGAAAGVWCVVDFDPSRREDLVRVAAEFRGLAASGIKRRQPTRAVVVAACLIVAGAVTAASVAPSHLRVTNPAPAAPQLVISFKAFGERVDTSKLDPAAEAAKPVHMRSQSGGRARRADVIVRVTVDGITEERAFTAKGVSRDGPAIGEWRRPWEAGEHQVVVEILRGGDAAPERWEGTMQARERRLSVIVFEPASGFVVDGIGGGPSASVRAIP
jgi:ferredoxin